MIPCSRFEWQKSEIQLSTPAIAPLVVRTAEKSDEDGVPKVLKSAFAVDAGWGDISRKLIERLDEDAEEIFSADEPRCLVVAHGTRVIGVSLLDTDPEAVNHLLSGPCILNEYRNRGLATSLLAASLEHLWKSGVKTVCGLTRSNSITARFVYPKFGGVAQPYSSDPLEVPES